MFQFEWVNYIWILMAEVMSREVCVSFISQITCLSTKSKK